MKIYESLSKVYDQDWGKFSLSYLKFIQHLNSKYSFKPSSILDVACGTGELISELYKLNYKVKGFDLSESMIHIARTKNPKIEYRIDDMVCFKCDKKYDLIICSFDAINYLIKKNQVLSTFENINQCLNEQSYFVFDFNTHKLFEEKHRGTIKRKINKIEFSQVLEYNHRNKIATTLFDFGDNETEKHIQRAYSMEEIDELLILTGFKVMDRYKDLKFTPVDKETFKAFYIVKKEEKGVN